MAGMILLAATVILLCLFFNKVSNKLGVPVLLAFILLGMVFGSDGVFRLHFDDYRAAEQICSVSLIFIMFYGGFGTSWGQARPAAGKAVLLSTAGVVLTALATGAFCRWGLGLPVLESLLIGAVTSSTDAASVFAILRSRRLNLKDNTASLLELESGSNDPCSYMLTLIVLLMMGGSFSAGALGWMVFAQIVFGVAVGVVTALAAGWILNHVRFSTDGFDTIFVFSMALVAYAGAAVLGGNGYLSTYLAGILLGNRPIPNKKALVHFFDGLTGLMQMLIFFLLGLLSYPSQLPGTLIPALAIALFLTFVARPLVTALLLTPFGCPLRQQLLVAWAGLRGASSIVFAIMAVVDGAYGQHQLFHIVFLIVLVSISLQGTLLPYMARRLEMIDDSANVMKTFSDYSEEIPVQFVRLSVGEDHPWVNRKIREIPLLPDLLLALILRNGEKIIPKGDVEVLPGDTVIVSGPSIREDFGVFLSELQIEKDSQWLGKPLSAVRLGENRLVVVIKRRHRTIIPNGRTTLREGDILVINQTQP